MIPRRPMISPIGALPIGKQSRPPYRGERPGIGTVWLPSSGPHVTARAAVSLDTIITGLMLLAVIVTFTISSAMALRDHTSLRALGPAADSIITYVVTAVVSVAALMTVRQIAPPRLSRWMGA